MGKTKEHAHRDAMKSCRTRRAGCLCGNKENAGVCVVTMRALTSVRTRQPTWAATDAEEAAWAERQAHRERQRHAAAYLGGDRRRGTAAHKASHRRPTALYRVPPHVPRRRRGPTPCKGGAAEPRKVCAAVRRRPSYAAGGVAMAAAGARGERVAGAALQRPRGGQGQGGCAWQRTAR